MALQRNRLQSLFSVAADDARNEHPVVPIIASDRPSSWSLDCQGKLVLPGDGPFSWQDLVSPVDRDVANANRDAYRLVVSFDEDADERTAIGIMRWFLELAAIHQRSQSCFEFGLFTARALERRYVGTGQGSASIWHRIPTHRDANAAASTLIRRMYGAATAASCFSKHANLLRPVGLPDPGTLKQRLVVFAFQHALEMNAQAETEHVMLDQRLTELHEDAPSWWDALEQDEELAKSRDAAFALIPDPMSIGEADAPIRAWWPLLTRLDHDHDHGHAVLESVA